MLTFGSDPELFIMDGDRAVLPQVLIVDGIFPVIGEYKGLPVVYNDEAAIVHVDGATLEIVLKRPYPSLIRVWEAVSEVRRRVSEKFGVGLFYVPATRISSEDIKYLPEDMRESVLFAGCNPDFDPLAVELGIETPTTGGIFKFKDLWRYAGGHISISGIGPIRDKIAKDHRRLSILFALTVGLTIVELSDNVSLERRRAKIYGTPAKYRPVKTEKTGIFEYRMPSNQWLSFSLKGVDVLDSMVRLAMNLFESGYNPDKDIVYSAAKAILDFDRRKAASVKSEFLKTL